MPELSADGAQITLPVRPDNRLCCDRPPPLALLILQVKYGDIVVVVRGTGGDEEFVPRAINGHTLGPLYTVLPGQEGPHFFSV